MKKLLSFFLIACFFISCNNNNKGLRGINGGEGGDDNAGSWSKKDRTKAIDQCVDEIPDHPQAKQICSCVVGKVEKKYTNYKDAEDNLSENELKKITQQCAAGLGGNGGDDNYDDGGNGKKKGGDDDDDYNDDNNVSGSDGWSRNDRSKFMNDCTTSLQQYQVNSQQICSCVLQKLENKYTNLDEANRKGVKAAENFTKECMGMGSDGGGDDYDNN